MRTSATPSRPSSRGAARAGRSTPCRCRSTTRRTLAASSASTSSMTGWNAPFARGRPCVDTRELVAQQALRRHHDERLAQRAQHLPAQHVEHLRRRRRHADLVVQLGGELQEALEPRRTVLRALPFVAVRQEQRDAGDAAPLGLARGDELVDDDLRAIHEVAELALPDHERRRIGRRVAVLEAEHRLLRQRRVDDPEADLVLRRRARAACRSCRSPGRAARRGGGRTCRAPCPGR